MTREKFPAHARQTDFCSKKGTAPELFVIVTGYKSAKLWFADGSHRYTDYAIDAKLKKDHGLEMTKITIPAHKVFIDHLYGSTTCRRV